MRPSSGYAAAVVTALALACTAPPHDPPTAPRPTPSALHTLAADPSPAGLESALDGPDRTAAWPAAGLTRTEAELVAVEAIIARLEDEGLYTLDLATSLEQPAPDRAQVTVRVLHGTGRGHPTEAVYTVELTRRGHTWTVTALQATS
jgi:hypothetical protein